MFLLLQMAPRRLSLHGNGREAERQEEGERTFSCLFAGCLASSDLSSIGSSPLKQEGVPVSSFCPPSQDASYCPSEGPAAARGRPSPGADSRRPGLSSKLLPTNRHRSAAPPQRTGPGSLGPSSELQVSSSPRLFFPAWRRQGQSFPQLTLSVPILCELAPGIQPCLSQQLEHFRFPELAPINIPGYPRVPHKHHLLCVSRSTAPPPPWAQEKRPIDNTESIHRYTHPRK